MIFISSSGIFTVVISFPAKLIFCKDSNAVIFCCEVNNEKSRKDKEKRLNWDEYFNHSFFKDEIILKYKIEDKNEIKILGKQFVEKNKNICYIIYKNKKYELKEYFKVEEKCLKNKILLSKSIVNLFIICPKGVIS